MAWNQMAGGLSADSYLERRLRRADAEHFSGGGIIPYRRTNGTLDVLLAWERPWNSFSKDFDPVSWNLFGGKRIPRQERQAETTAVRCFGEAISVAGDIADAPKAESMIEKCRSASAAWYATGKFAVLFIEVSDMDDLPASFANAKTQAGTQEEYRMTPEGVKRWIKQIDALEWVPAKDLVPTPTKGVSDLLLNILQVDRVAEFLNGKLGPTDLPQKEEAPYASERSSQGKGKGKYGQYGKSGNDSKGFSCKGKGKGGGGKFWDGPQKGMAPMPMGPGMYVGGKGMFMPMAPIPHMVYAPPEPPPDQGEVAMQVYGEQLYVLVQPLVPNQFMAQKITGMLLELPMNELMLNLTNHDELTRRVGEAQELLKKDGVC